MGPKELSRRRPRELSLDKKTEKIGDREAMEIRIRAEGVTDEANKGATRGATVNDRKGL